MSKTDNANKIIEVELDRLTLDPEIQARVKTNKSAVIEYAEAMKTGAEFPPILAYHADDGLLVADGFHRVKAGIKAGIKVIMVEIRTGDRRDAIQCALGANATHGLRRTNADKNRAVTKMLEDPEWSTWSNGVIASLCAVSDVFVGKIRKKMTPNGLESTAQRKVMRSGKEITMNTGNIGKKRKPKEAAKKKPAAKKTNDETDGKNTASAPKGNDSSPPPEEKQSPQENGAPQVDGQAKNVSQAQLLFNMPDQQPQEESVPVEANTDAAHETDLSAPSNNVEDNAVKQTRGKSAKKKPGMKRKPPTKTPTTQDMKEAAVNIRAALQGQSHESRIRAELYKEESTVRGYLHVILQSYNDNAEWARILVTGNGGPKLLKKLIEE